MVVRECKCHQASKRYEVRTINIDYIGWHYYCTFCQRQGYLEIHPRWPQ
jgi:hypothetical protein